MRKPNILILMADQLAASALPAYGNRVARTPHIDRLAETGVVFANAYCNSPLCGPSRAVFMSGQLPSVTGAYDNAAEFASDVPTFAHYLRRAGYRTVLAGKMHFCGSDQLHGFEERLTTDIYPADFGWTPDWDDFATRPSWYHSMDSVTQAGPCVRTNQLDFDEETAFAARQKLFDIARGSDPRPFCLVVSLTHPHDPFAVPEPYWSRYDPAGIDMPKVAQQDTLPDPHSARLRHVCAAEAQPVTEQHVRAARRAYYGAVSYVDDHIGALLQTLADLRLADDTIVILLSDHGEMLGERGLWYKMSFFEGACRIPLVVHAPAHFGAGRVEHCVSLADLLPTLAELAGDGQAPPYATRLDGRSLLPHLQRTGGHDEAIGEYLAEGVVSPMVMLRRGCWKYIHCPGDPDQLYRLDADPLELDDLARHPSTQLAGLQEEVDRRWDMPALRTKIVDSQRRRHLVGAALRLGTPRPWDFQPIRDASRQYMRNHMDLDDLEAMSRFPKVTP